MDESLNNDSLVQSTTIKTIRNLKQKNSYIKIPSGNENDSVNGINDVSQNQHTTPNIQVKDKKMNILLQSSEDVSNTEGIVNTSQHRSRPNSSSGFKNPMRKGQKMKMIQQSSNIFESERDVQKKLSVHRANSVTLQDNNSLNKDLLNFNPSKNPALENIEIREYDIIDMQYVIQFVITKSKLVLEKLENERVSQAFVEQQIIHNKFFEISYNSMLQKMIKQKQINAQFKNVSKRSFEKLEHFFIARIDKCLQQIGLQQNYLKRSKGIYQTLNQKMQELQKELQQQNKIEL